MNTTLVRSLLLLGATMLSACAPFRVGNVRVGDTPARKIAKDMSIPGKGTDGQCLPFALALHHKFQSAGIPSKVVVYDYESLKAPNTFAGTNHATPNGAHAVVVYNDDGRTYVMDNQSWLPTWVPGGSIVATAQQFSGMNFGILGAHALSSSDTAKSASF